VQQYTAIIITLLYDYEGKIQNALSVRIGLLKRKLPYIPYDEDGQALLIQSIVGEDRELKISDYGDYDVVINE